MQNPGDMDKRGPGKTKPGYRCRPIRKKEIPGLFIALIVFANFMAESDSVIRILGCVVTAVAVLIHLCGSGHDSPVV
ncbi:MAG: hypothetical protein P8129_20175 [Anaerolineae bacterium]|jgi:hypothetical protein